MSRTWMAGADRFFGDFLECSCGLAGPENSLKDPQRREQILRRFQENPAPQLPRKSRQAPEPTRVKRPPGPTSTPSQPPPTRNLYCPRCGEPLSPSPKQKTDRFFDDYVECPCGTICLNREPAPIPEEKPKKRDRVKREWVPEEPVVPLKQAPGPSAGLKLWARHYLVTVESERPAVLGLPRHQTETKVRTPRGNIAFDKPAYPHGFHAMLPDGLDPQTLDLRSEVGWLYEKLLKFPYTGQQELRRHLLAPLGAFCRVVNAAEPGAPPFEVLRSEHHLPTEVLYLKEFLERLLKVRLIPRRGELVSLTDVGTTPGFIDPADLALGSDELEILLAAFGSYRFSER